MVIDQKLISLSHLAVENKSPLYIRSRVVNMNWVVNTMRICKIIKLYKLGLSSYTIYMKLYRRIEQFLRAFICKKITVELKDDNNDYVGKELFGSKIIVFSPKSSTFDQKKNILIDNVAFYGAISKKTYFNCMVSKRFDVHNFGAKILVEEVGDYKWEYMIGGVVVFNKIGKNFIAWIIGVVGYVLNKEGIFSSTCNLELIDLKEDMDKENIMILRTLFQQHQYYTKNQVDGEFKANNLMSCF